MSLKTALETKPAHSTIFISKGILTIQNVLTNSIYYSCFVDDVRFRYPDVPHSEMHHFGEGKLVKIGAGKKWVIDFENHQHLLELGQKEAISILTT